MTDIIKCCIIGKKAGDICCPLHDERLKTRLREKMEDLIVNYGVNCFISGMEQGAEMFGAQITLQLKEKYPNLQLWCVIPYELQHEHLSEESRDIYFDVIEHCDKEIMLQTHYDNKCIEKKNRYLLDNSEYSIVKLYESVPDAKTDYAENREDKTFAI